MKYLLLITAVTFASSTSAQTLTDANLQVKTYLSGLDTPTGVAFLNSAGDALITQKNDGKVLLMHNRQITGTALDLPVANDSERGLLSIALSPHFATDQFVYLYHTAATADGADPISNKISRYRFDGSKLVFDRKIIDLPISTGPNHDGGKIAFDSKGKLYAVVGDLNRNEVTNNFENSGVISRRSVILRIQPNGGKISTNPFATSGATRTVKDDIFAYGVRNSFGLAFDPVTGALWDTENGPDRYDEINRVDAGFNSGWEDLTGPKSRNADPNATLSNLGAKAHYADPKFSWVEPVAPTDLQFLDSGRLGESYRDDLFVGNVNTGTLYHFDLNAKRNGLILSGALADGVADNSAADPLAEQSAITFGGGFGTVSDLIDGPGGLFVLSLSEGKLLRINERTVLPGMHMQSLSASVVPEPAVSGLLLISAPLLAGRRGRISRQRRAL